LVGGGGGRDLGIFILDDNCEFSNLTASWSVEVDEETWEFLFWMTTAKLATSHLDQKRWKKRPGKFYFG
jgi:hypothetical protein